MTEGEAKWTELVQGWKSSNQSADEYSAGLGVKASTLRWWSSHLSRAARAAECPEGSERSVRMVRVVSRARASKGSLMVHVGAARLEVCAGFDRALLRELVETLGGGG